MSHDKLQLYYLARCIKIRYEHRLQLSVFEEETNLNVVQCRKRKITI